MSRSPLFPTAADAPEQQRLLAGLKDFVAEALLRAGILRTPVGVQQSRVPTGYAVPLAWGTLNRLEQPYGGAAVLPRMRADTVNMPLFFAKASPSGLFRFIAGPRQDGTTPNVNGSPTGAYATGVGLGIALQDGRDWWLR